MALTRNVGRIDHVFITVAPKNFQACVEKLTRVLGLKFQTIYRPEENVQASVDWDSGMEVIAPMREEGPMWEKIQKGGEGQMGVVFGIDNMEKAQRRAVAEGASLLMDTGLNGEEPWFDRFITLKETMLAPIFGATIVLGEIDPKP